jgi:hypothetical protein
MSHEHIPGKPCQFRTLTACNDAYQQMQALTWIELARRAIAAGRAPLYRKDSSTFGQLVQVLAGLKETITSKDGSPSGDAFSKRLLAAIQET